MNISRADYIADSLEAKSFLNENGFLVHVEEEMTQVSKDGNSRAYPEATVVIIAVVIVVVFLAVATVLRHRSKQPSEQKPL